MDLTDTLYLHHLSKQDHGHVPYVLLLMKFLDDYRKNHDGKVPTTFKEKQHFKDLVAKHRWKNENGNAEEEENFAEACRAAVKVLGREKVII